MELIRKNLEAGNELVEPAVPQKLRGLVDGRKDLTGRAAVMKTAWITIKRTRLRP